MAELGVDLSDRRPQRLTPELAERADVVVTMGCGDACPFIPGTRYVEWDLARPQGPLTRRRARHPRRHRRSRHGAAQRARYVISSISQPSMVTHGPWTMPGGRQA